jgi:hypothetical protein
VRLQELHHQDVQAVQVGVLRRQNFKDGLWQEEMVSCSAQRSLCPGCDRCSEEEEAGQAETWDPEHSPWIVLSEQPAQVDSEPPGFALWFRHLAAA